MSLTFQPDGHRYFWEGKPVPSVTRILRPYTDLSMISKDTLEKARQEGVDVHRTIELECKRELDEGSLPTWLAPKLAAYRKFVADTGFQMVASEHRMYHKTFSYAGTLDIVGRMRHGGLALVDIKRSLLGGKVIGLQTSGYQMQWEDETKERIAQRFALVLNDGDYKLEPFADPRDKSVFLAALTMYRFNHER